MQEETLAATARDFLSCELSAVRVVLKQLLLPVQPDREDELLERTAPGSAQRLECPTAL
jgi:hypothetical protein